MKKLLMLIIIAVFTGYSYSQAATPAKNLSFGSSSSNSSKNQTNTSSSNNTQSSAPPSETTSSLDNVNVHLDILTVDADTGGDVTIKTKTVDLVLFAQNYTKNAIRIENIEAYHLDDVNLAGFVTDPLTLIKANDNGKVIALDPLASTAVSLGIWRFNSDYVAEEGYLSMKASLRFDLAINGETLGKMYPVIYKLVNFKFE